MVKTVAEKLQIKPDSRVLVVNAPPLYYDLIGDLPSGCTILERDAQESADFIHVFVTNRSELETAFSNLKGNLAPGGALWVSYYKGSSKIETDINRDSIWELGRQFGLDAVRQIAVDEDWSAIRFKNIG